MALPKIYRFLQELSPTQVKEFGLWLDSPVHHQHADVKILWGVLMPQIPLFPLSDAELFRLAFPDRPYDNARLRVLRNLLVNQLEDYLAWKEFQASPYLPQRLLREASLHLNVQGLGQKAWEAPTPPIYADPEAALAQYYNAEQHLVYGVTYANRSGEHDLHSVLGPLDSFYVITRLKYLCALADPMTRIAPLSDDPTLEPLFSLYHSLQLDRQPLAAIYYHLLNLFLGKPAERHLPTLQDLLASHYQQLDPIESLNLYTYWFNYLNAQYRAGVPGMLRKIFELYQQMVDLEVLFGEASFAANHFRNIVMVAASLREFDWGYQFLERYSSRLLMPWRVSAHAYCLGFLLYSEGRYSEAKRALQAVEFADWEYKIGQYMLFIRIYYEMNDGQGLEDQVNAMKGFLYRSKEIPKPARESAAHFGRLAHRLFQVKGMVHREAALARVKKAIAQCGNLRDRVWLGEKAGALEKKF